MMLEQVISLVQTLNKIRKHIKVRLQYKTCLTLNLGLREAGVYCNNAVDRTDSEIHCSGLPQ